MSSNDEVLTTPRSVIGVELEKQSNIDQRLSFCFDEERRKMKSFQERSNDLDQAIKWVLKEIKFLKQQDQSLMRQFVKLRSILNSVKTRAIFDRKISPPDSPLSSPSSPLYSISEESPTMFFQNEESPELKRRAETEPVSPVCFDDENDLDKYEHFAI
ncbi:uncharacterized protein LOC114961037 [Acropora millepora]|uniref:uncharacterized protein LOC114961037 n=1 Tax=Acropora millepora TaxID=45264 RepID=UPI0010FCC974|nr:uncharacterized protein LOC114961037 [Acropora millepora]